MLQEKKMSILIVDDIKFNLNVLKSSLNKIENIQILEAMSGQEAVDIALKEDISLILLDIMMPEMDGFETAEILSQQDKTKDIPIIFNTANNLDEKSILNGYKLGGVDYLVKPLSFSLVRKKVELYLNMQRYKLELSNTIEEENKDKEEKTIENKQLSQKLEDQVQIQMALKNAIAKTKKLILQANSAKSAKNSFLANMSHEIRTPIGGIIGIVNLLLEEEPDSEKQKILVRISNQAESLLIKINNILDISKLDANKIKPENINFNLDDILNDIIKRFNHQAKNKNIEIKIAIAENTPLNLKGDSLRISQIIINILDNAIKFAPENSNIYIDTDSQLKENNKHLFSFVIRDEGKGIKKKVLKNIFDIDISAMNLLDEKRSPKQGIGLGLPLSYKFAELLGGNLKVNDIAKGAELEFNLELEENRNVSLSNEIKSLENLEGLKILVAEDNMINQKLGKKLLTKLGAEVEIAKDGLIAFEQYKNAVSADEQFDCILMDCNMPNMDGFESTIAIREWEKDKDLKIPIVALTADTVEDAKENCLNAGMNSCLSKPLKKNKILNMLAEVLK